MISDTNTNSNSNIIYINDFILDFPSSLSCTVHGCLTNQRCLPSPLTLTPLFALLPMPSRSNDDQLASSKRYLQIIASIDFRHVLQRLWSIDVIARSYRLMLVVELLIFFVAIKMMLLEPLYCNTRSKATSRPSQ